MHGKDWGSGSSPTYTYCRCVTQHMGVSGAQTVSTQPLLCQCRRLALLASTTLPSCPAPAVPTGQQLPTASARGVRSDGCDRGKHKKWFLSLQAEKEVSHLDMYSSQAGKGTRHQEKRSRGLGGAALPRGRGETDGRFGSRVLME